MRITHIDNLLKQGLDKSKITFIVTHDYYGCDTGCCGHSIEYFIDGVYGGREFNFIHPSEDYDELSDTLISESPRQFKDLFN